MYDNIGGKIKQFAKLCAGIGIAISVMCGLAVMAAAGLLVGVLVAAIGGVASWVGSFVLYGFGQLVENSDKLVEASKKASSRQE